MGAALKVTETMGEADRKLTGIRFPLSVKTKLGHIAIDRGMSLNDLIIQATAQWYAMQPESSKYGNIPSEDVQPQKRGPKAVKEDLSED